jgi:hypothetical protein
MGKMGIRKVPLAAGIVAGLGLFAACVLQLMAGIINMAVIFGVAGVATMEIGVMASVIHRKPMLSTPDQMMAVKAGAMNLDSKPNGFTMLSPQPSMGHMDLRMDTASSNRENTGIYIESEELMRGGSLQELVYGSKKTAKKKKKAPAKSEEKRLEVVKAQSKSK